MQNSDTIKIALAQMNIVWEDKAENYKKAEAFMKEAFGNGTEAIFFPEMSFTGFSMNTAATKETEYETVSCMKTLARQYQMYVGFGWVKDCGQKCENHYTIVDKEGNVISDYAKIHPFSYSGEDAKFQGGSAITHFRLKGTECSNFICYDLRFPEIFQQASKKAHVMIVPANWPAKRREHWKTLLRARAIENQVYVLAINCVGEIGGLSYSGDSGVLNPNGDLLVSLSDKEGCLYCELPNDAEDFREAFPVKRDRREELYQALAEAGGKTQ